MKIFFTVGTIPDHAVPPNCVLLRSDVNPPAVLKLLSPAEPGDKTEAVVPVPDHWVPLRDFAKRQGLDLDKTPALLNPAAVAEGRDVFVCLVPKDGDPRPDRDGWDDEYSFAMYRVATPPPETRHLWPATVAAMVMNAREFNIALEAVENFRRGEHKPVVDMLKLDKDGW